MQHRKESGYRRYSEVGRKRAISKWSKYPHAVQQLAVDATLENGWQGVFPEKFSDTGPALNSEQAEAKHRKDVRSLGKIMQIEEKPGEEWSAYEARVTKSNERRIAAASKR